jgi:hypothetical protein
MQASQNIIPWIVWASVVLVAGVLWWRSRVAASPSGTDESFDGDVDDLQGNKVLGIRINGTRVLQVGEAGLRFTPNGSSDNQSALQFYYQGEISVGSWRLGATTGPAVTSGAVLSPTVRAVRIGNRVSIQVEGLGLTTFGAVPPKPVSTIVSETPLPSFLQPRSQSPGTFLLDTTKLSSPNTGLCVATVDSSGQIQIERFNKSATFAGNKATLNLTSFLLEYLV